MNPPSQNLVNAAPRAIGPHGAAVGPLALGLWRATKANLPDLRPLLEDALALGMNLWDMADVYGLDWGGEAFGEVEAQLGAALAAAPELRAKAMLASKGGIRPGVPYDSSAGYLVAACEASLKRLRTDHLDLYFIHRHDPFTPPGEVAQTLTNLLHAGKIRQVGLSNHTPAQVAALQDHLPFPLAAVQTQFSAHHLAPMFDGTLDQAAQMHLLALAWSPLAGGALSNAATATPDGPRPGLLSVLDDLARRENAGRAAVALAFTLCHPSRPVALVGSTRGERLREAAAALALKLDRADCYRIIEAATGRELP